MIVNNKVTVNLGCGCYAPRGEPTGGGGGLDEGEGVRILYSYRDGTHEMGFLASQMRWAPPMGSAVPAMVPEAPRKRR